MIILNRYDELMRKAKKIRTKIDRKNMQVGHRLDKIGKKIELIKYNKSVYLQELLDQLTDVNDLIKNERDRLKRDEKEEKGN